MSEARVRVICNAFRLEPLVTRGRNFASGKGAAIAGRCERTVCSSAGHRRACPRSRLTPKEPGHNERKVAMSTARAASCTESRGVCGICLGRNDGMRRSGMRGRNYSPFAIASSGHNNTSSPRRASDWTAGRDAHSPHNSKTQSNQCGVRRRVQSYQRPSWL
jgi:hypothetical protein